MMRKSKIKRGSDSLSQNAQELILTTAFDYPDFGARRLRGVLTDKKVTVTEGTIRSVLKQEGLHTRELRLRRLEERYWKEGIALSNAQRQALEKFNPCLQELNSKPFRPGQFLIVDAVDFVELTGKGKVFLITAIDLSCGLSFGRLSKTADNSSAIKVLTKQVLPFYSSHKLAFPATDHGPGIVLSEAGKAGWLRLLERHGIPTWRKARNLVPQKNGFTERFERIVRSDFLAPKLGEGSLSNLKDLQKEFASWLDRYNTATHLSGYPTWGRTPMQAFESGNQLAAPEKENKIKVEAEHDPSPLKSAIQQPLLPQPAKMAAPILYDWKRWPFRIIDAGLVFLLIYFIWVITSQLPDFWRQRYENTALFKDASANESVATDYYQSEVRPLEDYRKIWSRNLFGTSKIAEDQAFRKNISVQKIALAEKNFGLRLIGTVVAHNPVLNYAVIDVAATREQGIFRENERVGKAIVYRIMRNTVVVLTDAGQHRLLTVEDEPVNKSQAAVAQPRIYETSTPAAKPPENQARPITFQIPIDKVKTALLETQRLVRELPISQNIKNAEPDSLGVGPGTAKNPLAHIGLRSGDVVKALDGKEIMGPVNAEELLEALAEGGDFTILVERRGRMQKLNLSIN